MAIDDNTSYELTGYQVKDLAQKIRAKADSASLASVATSGLYSDLTGAPTIPTVYNGTLTIQQNGTTIGTFSANQSTNETINITGGGGGASYTAGNGISIDANNEISVDTTVVAEVSDLPADFTGATSSAAGAHGLVPAPALGDKDKFLKGDGTWEDTPVSNGYLQFRVWDDPNGTPQIVGDWNEGTNDSEVVDIHLPSVMTGATSSVAGASGLAPAPAAGDQEKVLHGDGTWKDTTAKLVEMSYGESNAWAKFIAAYNAGSIVYCRASSNSNPATGSQTRKAFMAYVNNATTPTEVEFQYVRSMSTKTDSQQCDQVFVYKLTNASGGTWTVTTRNMAPKIVAGTGMSGTFTTGANATITLNAEPNYSTSEVDTKVKWIDGKTIYRKTINCGTLPNATSKRVSIGASGVSRYVKIEGVAFTSNNTTISLPYVNHSSASYQVDVYIDSGDLVISAGDDKSAYANSYITVYYTKS